MTPQAKRASQMATLAQLAQAFSDRRCSLCGSDHVACVLVGRNEVRESGILLAGKRADLDLCLACALALPTRGSA